MTEGTLSEPNECLVDGTLTGQRPERSFQMKPIILIPKMIIEINEQWKEDHLVSLPDFLLKTVKLSEDTKDFLEQIGIPKQISVFTGAIYEALPISLHSSQPSSETEDHMLQRLPGTSLLCIARTTPEVSADFICIHEDRGTIGFKNLLDEEFLLINSSVQAFVECLFLYDGFTRSKKTTNTLIRSFQKDLKRVDPSVFDENKSYWSLAIEDFSCGGG
jgi:hypothetical protein